MTSWMRRHRALTAFAAGVLLTFVGLAAVAYFVVSDQRRSAGVLAVALSRALAREVRIDRVTELGAARVVMRGVSLSREGGWPADVVAEEVEATGPLLAAARGDAAPVRLVVTRPTVTVPGGATGGLPPLGSVRQGIASFLGGPLLLDISLAGGQAGREGSAVEFDLVLRKGPGQARGELTMREGRGAPLTFTVDARMDGDTARLGVEGRGGLTPLAARLPGATAAALRARPLTLALEIGLGPTDVLTVRGGVAVGDAIVAEGEATLDGGRLRVSAPRATADLEIAALAAGLPWQPTGRAELSDIAVSWQPDGGGVPAVHAGLRLSTVALPAAAVGADIAAEGLEGRLVLEPAPTGAVLHGALRGARVRAAGVEVAPLDTRYRVGVDAGWGVARIELDALRARIEGATVQGRVGYDAGARRMDAELAGEEVEAGDLVRRVAPGWLSPGDRLRLTGLRLRTKDLDPRGLDAGVVGLEARVMRLSRADGQVAGRRAQASADLRPRGITVALDVDGVVGSLPVFQGEVPRLTATAALSRRADGTVETDRADVTARDAQRRELLVAELRPAGRAGWLALSARAPALERLEGLWPAIRRRLNGSARLDVEVGGPGYRTAEGRLALTVPEGELMDGRVSVRDLAAEIPVRRGAEPGEPPWGTLEIGELIGGGLVVRDLTSPARVFKDRLSLNDLTYALYSGTGKGWTELELPLDSGAPLVRGKLTGERVRVEEFVSAYGIRGGTMTGLLRYDVNFQYRAGRLGVNGRFEVPEGGTVNIELLNRLLAYAPTDPTGVLRSALQNLRAFDYKSAEADLRSAGDDIQVGLSLRGRELFLIFPPKVPEINIRGMPLSFLARQFPGS